MSESKKKTFGVEVSAMIINEYEIEAGSEQEARKIAQELFSEEQDLWPGDIFVDRVYELKTDPEDGTHA